MDTPGVRRGGGDLDAVVGTVHRLGDRRRWAERRLSDVAELRGRRGGPELPGRGFAPSAALDLLPCRPPPGHRGVGALGWLLEHRLGELDRARTSGWLEMALSGSSDVRGGTPFDITTSCGRHPGGTCGRSR